MSRRSSTDPNDALELFLDTITNTFGGVLFIALVVSILVQNSGPGAAVDRVEVIERENELAALQAEIGGLDNTIELQEDQISKLRPKGNPENVRRYKRLQEEERKVRKEYRTLSSKTRALNREHSDSQKKIRNLKKKRRRLAAQEKRVKAQLKESRESTAHRIRLPRFRSTTKEQVAVLLTGQHMFFAHKFDSRGRALAISDDVTVKWVIPNVAGEMKAKPGRGMKITDANRFRATLKGLLRKFNKNKHYITVAVWPDSYKQFEILRDALVDMGFEYGLIIMAKDETVGIGAGGDAGVQ